MNVEEKISDWPVVPLGQLADFRNGINYNKSNFGKGIKVINVGDFKDRSFVDVGSLGEINPKGIVHQGHLLKDNDILFVRSNGNRNLIGRSLFIRGLQEPISHSAFTIRLRFHSDKVFSRYYAYLFRSDLIRQALSARGGGTNISNLNQEILNSLEVPLPSLDTQQKIATVLSAYDDLIENNTRRIQILEEMAQALYRQWFVEFQYPGHEDVPLVDSGTELGEIPQGWEVGKVGDRFTVVLGGTPSRRNPAYWKNGTVPWINSGKSNELRVLEPSELITELGLNKSSTKMMPKRTTIIAITGATLGQVSLTEIETCANQSIVGVWDEAHLYTEYIYLTFCAIIQEVIQHAGGSAQQHINKEIVNAVEIFLPPTKIVKEFQNIVRPFFNLLENLMWKNANLRATRDLLLPRLVSGVVDVSDVSIKDE
ncbi:MAG: restriction endonuclease subunit S [Chloroflexi bacterium]|nr:restriction endonuclease subunit S [Chloroflexota bacterium]